GVRIGAARDRVHRSELSRRRRVAEGDEGGDGQGDEDAGPGRTERRRPHREDTGADHRTEADGDGIRQCQTACEWHPSMLSPEGERQEAYSASARVTRFFSRMYTSRRTFATTSPVASVMTVSNHCSTFAPPRARSRRASACSLETWK